MIKVNKRAFTLAEVMIVFTVIGILTAILVPSLFASSPDQQKLRARKAYNTLSRAVENLTNSSPYDTNGGLLVSTGFTTDQDDRNRFFCNNLAEALNVKSANCIKDSANDGITNTTCSTSSGDNTTCTAFTTDTSRKYLLLTKTTSSSGDVADYTTLQTAFDTACESAYFTKAGTYNLATADGVLWGIQLTDFSNPSILTLNSIDTSSFYNLICIDVDNQGSSDYVYGAGIRKDGKIVVGAKLQEIVSEDYDSVMNNE